MVDVNAGALFVCINQTNEFSDRFSFPPSENYFALLIFQHPPPPAALLILFRSPYLYLMKLEGESMPFGTSNPLSLLYRMEWLDTLSLH